jgi:hypothetical protein
MEVHAKYHTERQETSICFFNERFVLSLAVDEDLNILSLSGSVAKSVVAIEDASASVREGDSFTSSVRDRMLPEDLEGCFL